MIKISVVIPHYYEEREGNLVAIIDALNLSSLPPDEILIWCNTPLRHPSIVLKDHVSLFLSPRNVGCQARFITALMTHGNYVLFQDNDVCVRPRTLENLWGKTMPGTVSSLDGYQVPPVGYVERRRFYGWSCPRPVPVNVTLGRMEMVERDTLLRVLRYFPFGSDTEMDDLAFSAACKKVGVPIFVVPALDRDEVFINLPDGGVGLSRGMPLSYVERRDRAFRELGL